jgi:hypothetical protein
MRLQTEQGQLAALLAVEKRMVLGTSLEATVTPQLPCLLAIDSVEHKLLLSPASHLLYSLPCLQTLTCLCHFWNKILGHVILSFRRRKCWTKLPVGAPE